MTCKECIHHKSCFNMAFRCGYKAEALEGAETCEDFKNKADFVEVVFCKDCIWFVPEHIKLSDGTTRPYTDEEKKLPCGVTSDIGINVGSYCLRKDYWEQNSIPVWFRENDFCSYGKRK